MDTAKGIDVRDVIENLFDVCDVIDAHVIVHRLRDKQAREGIQLKEVENEYP